MKNKQTKPKRILSVRGTILTLPTLDTIEGPALVFISPESIFISDTYKLKIHKKCLCVVENIETGKTNINLEDYFIPVYLDQDNGIDIDLKDISYLFKTTPELEFEKLSSEDFLLFEFGGVRTKSVLSQEDLYSNYSLTSLFEELQLCIGSYEYEYIICAIEKSLRKKINSIGSLDLANLKNVLEKIENFKTHDPATNYQEMLEDLQTLIEQKIKKTINERKTTKKEKFPKKEDLERALKKALEKEDYERASQIRDSIIKITGNAQKT